jgi:ABC-type sugar transport system, permease component
MILARAARVLFLLVLAVFFAVPLIWLLMVPTKTDGELSSRNPMAFGSLHNVARAWTNLMSYNHGEILLWLQNSVLYSVIGVAIAVVIALPAGYSLAVYRFRGRKLILLLTVMAMIVPVAATVLPIYRELSLVHLPDTRWSVILPTAFFPFGVYLSYLHYQSGLPVELLESARLDGASELRVFRSIGLPLGKPAIALTTFFAFVASWNNYFLPYIMLVDDKLFTLQLGIATLLSSSNAINASNVSNLPIHRPEAALAALISVIPIGLFFLAFQRVLGRGVLTGAVKG